MEELLEKIIKERHLRERGYSFTNGWALYYAILKEGLPGNQTERFKMKCWELYPEMRVAEKLGLELSAAAWAEMLDKATLNDLAEELMGEFK